MFTSKFRSNAVRIVAAIAAMSLLAAACGSDGPQTADAPTTTAAPTTTEAAPETTTTVQESDAFLEGLTETDEPEPATTTTAAEPEPEVVVDPSLVVDPITVSEGLNSFTLEGAGFDPGLPTWTLLCPLASGLTEDSPEEELAAAMASVTSDDCDLATSRSVTFDDEGSFTTEREAIVIGNFMWVASDAAETQVAAAAVFMEAPEPEPTVTSVPVAVDDPSIADRALAFLAGELGVPETEITLTGTEAVAWPDTSLGCPKEGYAYAQVLTPGYRFTFSHGTATHGVHSDEDGTLFVRPVGCYDPTESEPTTTTQPEPEPTPTTLPEPEPEPTTTTVPEPDLEEATAAVQSRLGDYI